ncbi:MAG: FAD-binding oxidoreductase [Candidatus Saccharimonas sp.]
MKRYVATVKKIEYVGDDMVEIYFSLPKKSDVSYDAGQYITIFFDDSSTPAGKPYSLSSAPHEALLSITVKRVGEFSGRLYHMEPGDTFEMSEAYGHFNPHATRPIIALSAGVGIAPVWSVIKNELRRDKSRIAQLYYSNKSHEAIAHRVSIDTHADSHGGFKVHHHITRRVDVPKHMMGNRINLDACISAVEGEANYLICGSVDFVRDMWRGLLERGIPQELISTEIFFE